jgi:hypothetical protein
MLYGATYKWQLLSSQGTQVHTDAPQALQALAELLCVTASTNLQAL